MTCTAYSLFRMGVTVDAAAGAFSGLVARLISAPFDVIKIRMQLSHQTSSVPEQMREIVQREGFLALWKGNLSATLLWVSYSLVQFSAYGYLKERSAAEEGDASAMVARPFLCGVAAGTSAATATYPFDIMRTQFALQGSTKFHDSMYSFASHTLKTHGIRGFYAGLSASVLVIAPQMGLNFAIYDNLKLLVLQKNKNSNNGGSFSIFSAAALGGIAGGTSKLIVYPMDTVKKRLQAQKLQSNLEGAMTGKTRYSGVLNCLRSIAREEGVAGLYRGITPTLLKSISSVGISFGSYEFAKGFLLRQTSEEHNH